MQAEQGVIAPERNDPHREEARVRIEIHVNEKPVHVHGHRHDGLQIKKAAIDQGVKIKLDFLLYLLRHGQPNQPIGDEEEIRVTHESRFHAISDDDNS
jgi:hypothetical protein